MRSVYKREPTGPALVNLVDNKNVCTMRRRLRYMASNWARFNGEQAGVKGI